MDGETNSVDTINFRLSQIEASLKDVKDLLISVKMAGKDIEDLQSNYKKIEDRLAACEAGITELKQGPDKKAAEKWHYIMDYIFKFVVAGVVALFATKIGIGG